MSLSRISNVANMSFNAILKKKFLGKFPNLQYLMIRAIFFFLLCIYVDIRV